MRRLLVNDQLSALGERTFWHLLQEWFGCEFVGGDYATLAEKAARASMRFPGVPLANCTSLCSDPYNHADIEAASLIIRNATWFPPIKTDVPTIALLQDIITEGPQREMQEAVIKSSRTVVFNSEFTWSKYQKSTYAPSPLWRVIPLPVDFSLFEPQNAMGCQQALGLPDGCVCWIGASQGAAGQVKGWDIMQSIARHNPDLHFVCVFKDAIPASIPPNMRAYARVSHEELVRIIGACRVGLCTSRMESQHLAGIEMGACGLPMVAPPVGVYWNGHISGVEVKEPTVSNYTQAIRAMLTMHPDGEHAREFWRKDFDIPVVRAAWTKLVEEVEK